MRGVGASAPARGGPPNRFATRHEHRVVAGSTNGVRIEVYWKMIE
jgi:hypothetical protein